MSYSKTPLKKCLVAAAISACFSSYTVANEQQVARQNNAAPATVEQPEEVEKIIVTGSRLRRTNFDTPSPIVSVGKNELNDTGLGSLSEILVDQIPAISESFSNTNSQSSVQNTGLSTINLRDLGTDRTLTLIDGRRVVSNSYSGNYISLGTIPSGMVQRVEVISGGASAVYGSDAIAGVVNIITQTDKLGSEIKVRGGTTPEGGGDEFTLDAEHGFTFANSQGYGFFSATWDRQFGINWEDRDRAAIEASYDYLASKMCNAMNTIDGDQCMRDITQADWRERSDGTYGGGFEEGLDAADGGYYYTADGLQSGWNEERDGINYEMFDKIKVPNDRFAAALKLDYDLNDSVRGYAQVQYSKTGSRNVKSPEDEYEGADALILDPLTGAAGEISPGYIELDNPFLPDEIRDNAKGRINWDRRFAEVGPVTTDNSRETIRSWAGLKGTAFNDEWDWDVSVGYGTFEQKQKRLNELNTVRVRQALASERLADGTVQCKDADARAEGCVPLNIFGIGSITPEMADWIRATPVITTDITQLNVQGYMTGDLFEMPAGPVATAFGFEYRRDTQDVITNKEQRYGGVTFNVVPTFSGDMDIYEAFAEASIPLLRDTTLAKSLDLETSLRIANYSPEGIDTMASYRAGFSWVPASGYMVRANYSRAQRAPNITELMSPPRGDFDSFSDICDGVTATSTELGHDACRQEAGIAQAIANEGVFEDENSGYSPNTGNELLKEETADTYTLGLTIQPDFAPNLGMSFDYYDIQISDSIEQIGNEDILQECYASAAVPFGENNSFCGDITRDSDGQITQILQRVFNLSETRTRGYDIAINYRYDLPEYGSLRLKLDWNHVTEYSITYEGNDGTVVNRYDGELDSGIFTDKARASLTWSYEDLRVRWTTKYKSDIVDSHDRVEDMRELFAENAASCAAGDDSCVENPEQPKYLYYPSYITHDISLSYNLALQGDQDVRLFAGVNNIFDDQGPFIPYTGDNVEHGVGNFDSEYGGGVGRFVYLGAQYSF